MKLYTFSIIAILAVTMAPIPVVNAGLLDGLLGGVTNFVGNTVGSVGNAVGGIVGGVGNVVGGIVNDVGNVVGGLVNVALDILGGPGFARGGKILTLRRMDSKVIGHLNGDPISIVEQYITKPGESIYFRVTNNNTQLVITNKAGKTILRLSGPNVQGLIHMVLKYGGQISGSLSHLGKVENGMQTILDADNVVIEQVAQNVVHKLGGGITLVGNSPWDVSKDVVGLSGEILKLQDTLIGSAITAGTGLINGGISLPTNIINGIINGIHGVEKLDGSKVISVMDASNKIVGHLYGKDTLAIELLAKRLGGIISLNNGSGSVAVLNQAGQSVGFINGPRATQIKDLIQYFGGCITLMVHTIYNRLDNDGSKILAVYNATGSVMNKVPINAIHAINVAAGNVPDKIMIIGSGLNGLADYISSLVSGVAQLVSSSLGGSSSTSGTTNSNENSNVNANGSGSNGGLLGSLLGGSGSVSTGSSNGGLLGGLLGGSGSVSSGGSSGGLLGGLLGGSGSTGGSNGGLLGGLLGGSGSVSSGSSNGGLLGGLLGGSGSNSGLLGGLLSGSGSNGGLLGGLLGRSQRNSR